MAIRVKNPNRKYTTEMIVNACIGTEDPHGNPFELITLDWNPQMRNAHQAKTKGFEDTFITRKPEGGLAIEYRTPGNAEWLKDGLTGRYNGQVARTPENIKTLAHNFYDKLWTIRDSRIREEVKALADAIDEAAKKVVIPIMRTNPKKIENELTGEVHMQMVEEQVGEETLYDFHVRRRGAHFKAPGSVATHGVASNTVEADLALIQSQKAQLFKMQKEIDEKMKAIMDQTNQLAKRQKKTIDGGVLLTQYDRAFLEALKPFQKLRGLAREMGVEVTFKMKKEEIIQAIMDKQNSVVAEPEEVVA